MIPFLTAFSTLLSVLVFSSTGLAYFESESGSKMFYKRSSGISCVVVQDSNDGQQSSGIFGTTEKQLRVALRVKPYLESFAVLAAGAGITLAVSGIYAYRYPKFRKWFKGYWYQTLIAGGTVGAVATNIYSDESKGWGLVVGASPVVELLNPIQYTLIPIAPISLLIAERAARDSRLSRLKSPQPYQLSDAGFEKILSNIQKSSFSSGKNCHK